MSIERPHLMLNSGVGQVAGVAAWEKDKRVRMYGLGEAKGAGILRQIGGP